MVAVLAAVAGVLYVTGSKIPMPWQSPGPGVISCGPDYGSCQSGFTCIQQCGPPVAREGDPPPPYYCATDAVAGRPRNCPICLASNTRISTPSGPVNVKDIRVGSVVWSVDNGHRVASTVARISRAATPRTHRVVHLSLSDARQLWVSPGHPTASGIPVGLLRVGDVYDGATVLTMNMVPYWDDATYDILPDSITGQYWANDILMGSTLKR